MNSLPIDVVQLIGLATNSTNDYLHLSLTSIQHSKLLIDNAKRYKALQHFTKDTMLGEESDVSAPASTVAADKPESASEEASLDEGDVAYALGTSQTAHLTNPTHMTYTNHTTKISK